MSIDVREWIGRHRKNAALSEAIGTTQETRAAFGRLRASPGTLGYIRAPYRFEKMVESWPNEQTRTSITFCEAINAYRDFICGDIDRYTWFRSIWCGFTHSPAVFNVKRWRVQCGAHTHTWLTNTVSIETGKRMERINAYLVNVFGQIDSFRIEVLIE